MRRLVLLLMLCGAAISGFAQSWLWVSFTDKGDLSELSQPHTFLSEAALQRRASQSIAVTVQDLPVSGAYLQGIRPFADEVKMTSRWFNAALIRGQAGSIQAIEALPYVKSVRLIISHDMSVADAGLEIASEPMSYGQSEFQLDMLNLPAFHQKGYLGQGMRMAILDAGFPGVDTLDAFDSLRSRGGILATWDFVEDTSWVYQASSHGTRVLSTIATFQPGQIVGAAPMADVMLFRTEDARREMQIEEFNWLAAVEMADSLGVDIIHSSLGYNNFQDSPGYEYEDLDGDKAIVTKAADWAAQRGILVVTSAGNEGRNSWHYITAPCDGDSILCVGSVTRWHDISNFSSVGPSADGRVKPDVVAMGTGTTTFGPSPRIQLSNGTSFAAPIVAGFTACLWQAHREASNMDIIQAIRLSSDQAGLPDDEYGYGIPNAIQADSLLSSGDDLYSLTIVQRAKPPRGKEAMEAKEQQQQQATPGELSWKWDAYHLVIDLPSPTIRVSQIHIKRGEQHVTPNPEDIRRDGPQFWINTERWLPGNYTVTIEALEFTRAFTVSVPR